MKLYRHGDRLRVKRTRRGIAVNSPSPHDFVVTTGEIGTVTRTPYTAHDGTPMANWRLEFSRGRRIGMTIPESRGYAESDVACFYSEGTDKLFVKVKSKP